MSRRAQNTIILFSDPCKGTLVFKCLWISRGFQFSPAESLECWHSKCWLQWIEVLVWMPDRCVTSANANAACSLHDITIAQDFWMYLKITESLLTRHFQIREPLVLVTLSEWRIMSGGSCLEKNIRNELSWIPRFVVLSKLFNEEMETYNQLLKGFSFHWPCAILHISCSWKGISWQHIQNRMTNAWFDYSVRRVKDKGDSFWDWQSLPLTLHEWLGNSETEWL